MRNSLFTLFALLLFLTLASPAAASNREKTKSAATKIDVQCVQHSIEKRDTAISVSWDTYSSAMKQAFATRAIALKAVWAKGNEAPSKRAIQLVWAGFKKMKYDASKAWRAGKKAAWKEFYADRKICGRGVAAKDLTTERIDADTNG